MIIGGADARQHIRRKNRVGSPVRHRRMGPVFSIGAATAAMPSGVLIFLFTFFIKEKSKKEISFICSFGLNQKNQKFKASELSFLCLPRKEKKQKKSHRFASSATNNEFFVGNLRTRYAQTAELSSPKNLLVPACGG